MARPLDSMPSSGDAGADAHMCGPCTCTPSVDGVNPADLIGDAQLIGGIVQLTPAVRSRAGGVVFASTLALAPRFYVSLEFSITTAPTQNVGDGIGIGWLGAVPSDCAGAGSNLCLFNNSRPGVVGLLRFADPVRGHLDNGELALMDATRVSTDSPLDGNTAFVSTASVAALGALAADASGREPPPETSWHRLELYLDAAPTPRLKLIVISTIDVTMATALTLPKAGAMMIGAATGESVAEHAIRNVHVSVLDEGCAF